MDQVRQGLCPSSSLMEISPLSTERIRRHHRLGLEAIPADGTAQIDLTQSRQFHLVASPFWSRKEFLCQILVTMSSKVGLVGVFLPPYFLASKKCAALLPLTCDPVVDAHQPAARLLRSPQQH